MPRTPHTVQIGDRSFDFGKATMGAVRDYAEAFQTVNRGSEGKAFSTAQMDAMLTVAYASMVNPPLKAQEFEEYVRSLDWDTAVDGLTDAIVIAFTGKPMTPVGKDGAQGEAAGAAGATSATSSPSPASAASTV